MSNAQKAGFSEKPVFSAGDYFYLFFPTPHTLHPTPCPHGKLFQ
ncbi:hypothetical protein O53_2084 [Microcystis aeruginosa TAIHU98]|uniref:Uncharacterized protein n=1 Tax=Microcystis aeruginosa TAIHU98 TaxID=1134457 RepID=L7E1F9_MICAE|nr:hypothetical protein O53_2084 [Microcystis aeruginosa TAIHU98]MDB9428389.1 hypothetical protein [Microcystis aeruginosa CS-555/01A07]ODV38672.1 hypothetical protein BFG60_1839 [Microcystis aeruginosa NIES-98]